MAIAVVVNLEAGVRDCPAAGAVVVALDRAAAKAGGIAMGHRAMVGHRAVAGEANVTTDRVDRAFGEGRRAGILPGAAGPARTDVHREARDAPPRGTPPG